MAFVEQVLKQLNNPAPKFEDPEDDDGDGNVLNEQYILVKYPN